LIGDGLRLGDDDWIVITCEAGRAEADMNDAILPGLDSQDAAAGLQTETGGKIRTGANRVWVCSGLARCECQCEGEQGCAGDCDQPGHEHLVTTQ
jgi:hypothetical protein